jgi:SAM-dependent methyltransferase
MRGQIIKNILFHPDVRDVDIDAPETIRRHARLIQKKKFLKQLYGEWYRSILKAIPSDGPGIVVEIGSGGGFIHEVDPSICTTDILNAANLNAVLDAASLPFKDQSLKAIVMVDVLHHLPRVRAFFQEASRCIQYGGRIIMIEPWNTLWSRWIYRRFHREPFDPEAKNWRIRNGGPMTGSNQALPWILFERDFDRFKSVFPEWSVDELQLHSPFSYLVSGGVSFRSLLPGKFFRFWREVEDLFMPFMPKLAMFATIRLVRTPLE